MLLSRVESYLHAVEHSGVLPPSCQAVWSPTCKLLSRVESNKSSMLFTLKNILVFLSDFYNCFIYAEINKKLIALPSYLCI